MSRARIFANMARRFTSTDLNLTGNVTATSFSGDGSALTNLPSSTPTTADVLSATAGAGHGAVGSYAFCVVRDNGSAGYTTASWGSLYPGSYLRPVGVANYYSTSYAVYSGGEYSSTLAGTWRAMGHTVGHPTNRQAVTLFLRIS